jgi:hypothetical protein
MAYPSDVEPHPLPPHAHNPHPSMSSHFRNLNDLHSATSHHPILPPPIDSGPRPQTPEETSATTTSSPDTNQAINLPRTEDKNHPSIRKTRAALFLIQATINGRLDLPMAVEGSLALIRLIPKNQVVQEPSDFCRLLQPLSTHTRTLIIKRFPPAPQNSSFPAPQETTIERRVQKRPASPAPQHPVFSPLYYVEDTILDVPLQSSAPRTGICSNCPQGPPTSPFSQGIAVAPTAWLLTTSSTPLNSSSDGDQARHGQDCSRFPNPREASGGIGPTATDGE